MGVVYIGSMLRWLTIFVLLCVVPVQAADLSGRVVAIADGDTFTVLTADKQQVKIRLAEIDAPESGQPYGNKSKQALSGLIFGKDVRVVVQTTDRYGRTVGRPYVGGLDVSAEMVRMGAAWAYREYLKDRSLLTLEAEAKADKRGVWALSEAQNMPPWEWRPKHIKWLPDKGQYQLEGRQDLSRAWIAILWCDQNQRVKGRTLVLQ